MATATGTIPPKDYVAAWRQRVFHALESIRSDDCYRRAHWGKEVGFVASLLRQLQELSDVSYSSAAVGLKLPVVRSDQELVKVVVRPDLFRVVRNQFSRTAKAFETLLVLVQQSEQVVSRPSARLVG